MAERDRMSASVVTTLDALPSAALALFGQDIFSTVSWYRTVLGHALQAGTNTVFLLIRSGETIAAVFPLQRGPAGRISALTTPYTGLWRPLLAPSLGGGEDIAAYDIGRAFGRFCGNLPPVRLDALDPANPILPPLLRGMREAGMIPLSFDHFGNWHIVLNGESWNDYLAARPGALREAIRRRGRKLMDELGARFSVITAPDALPSGIHAYETIYAASWKPREPYPNFAAAFMRASAEDGTLRLGLLELDGAPIAAQIWVKRDGWAGVLKLAHAETHRALSPGTVLTALMIRCLLEEGATELDFGRGDDPYKKLWADSRRQRTGIVLAKPSTLKGATTIARHEAGRFTEKIKSLFVSFSSEKERIFFLERKKQRTFKSGARLSGRAPSLPSA